MKRCNNCGWFNLDTAVRCEMCDDEGLEHVAVQPSVNAEPEKVAEPEPVKESVPQPDPVVSAKKKSMMATVAFGAEQASVLPRKAMTATVMDVNAVVGDETVAGQCPKCNYPVTAEVEFCPNCGATVRKPGERKQAPTQAPAASGMATVRLGEADSTPISKKTVMLGSGIKSKFLKATVRDIPEELMTDDKDIFRLVPVDGAGEAPIEMHLDEIVVISGVSYKFQK